MLTVFTHLHSWIPEPPYQLWTQNFCRLIRMTFRIKRQSFETPLTGLPLRTAGAHRIHPIAASTARVVTEDVAYAIEVIVISSCSNDLILGWDFLSCHNVVIHCARAELELFHACFSSEQGTRQTRHQRSSEVVSIYCSSLSVTVALLSPSGRFSTLKGLLLPFATLKVTQGSRFLVRSRTL